MIFPWIIYQTRPYIKVKNREQNTSIVKILLWVDGAKPFK